MALFYVMRPSAEPVGWDSQRRAPLHQYTRFRGMQHKRDAAIRSARRVQGRAYEYDGEHRLIFDAQRPDLTVGEHARA
jgi:hypothetical protein